MNTLRVEAVASKVGLGVSTVWQWSRRGDFPKPFLLSNMVAVWDEEDIDNWLKAKKEISHGSSNAGEAQTV